MSITSPMMGLSGSVATNNSNNTEENHFQTCDSPSGSSTSEPHDDAMNIQQPSFIDQSFFYKLDQLSPDNPLYFSNNSNNSNNNNNNNNYNYNSSSSSSNSNINFAKLFRHLYHRLLLYLHHLIR
ncbi:hypothetical protein BD408DRAFT_5436 [Parasitella parasitica]|nr:hypothetical protein BD408DRAFT_5436 [Parasitella parasitica]